MTRQQLDRLLEQTVADALGVKLERSPARRPNVVSAKPRRHTQDSRQLEHT